MTANPYTPGAGLYPPYLAGREQAQRALQRAREAVEAGGGASPLVVTGLRGMGKTSLLLGFREELAAAGWLVPSLQEFDTRRPLATIWPGLRDELEALSPRRLPRQRGRRWESRSLEWRTGAEVGPAGPRVRAEAAGSVARVASLEPGEEALRAELLAFLPGVFGRELSLGLLFDEAQDASLRDLGLLAELGHRAAQQRWPLLIVFAGLTPLHDKLVRARSYATRFPALPVQPLSRQEAAEALEVPAQQRSVKFEAEGLAVALDFAAGVPYHLQMIGQHAWERRLGDRLRLEAIVMAVPAAREEIATGMYRPLWNRASEAEQEYLIAMAGAERTHQGIPVAQVLQRLSRDHRTGATLRARLINKGLIHPQRYGHLEFSYPGFRDFVAREAEVRG